MSIETQMQHHRPNLKKKSSYENGSMDDKNKSKFFFISKKLKQTYLAKLYAYVLVTSANPH